MPGLACAILTTSVAHSDPIPAINFDRDIRPLLADSCFACHGPNSDKRKAHLRLDTREGLFGPTRDASDAGRDDSLPTRIVDPDHSSASELARRINADDDDTRMPPPESVRHLSSKEKALLTQWIDAGAPWSGHWAFEPIKAAEIPKVANPSWCCNPIDHFILAEIARQTNDSIKPSAQAGKRTLLRRVSLDLTGLPPTREEIAAFLSDNSSRAYDAVVDRLLYSPRFGEHFAATWLDVARYADSNGFQLDPDRTAWPWRDWVINAFNTNLPYDQFVLDQVAGDLEPNATPSQVLASAFNRMHPINGEGGQDFEESRINYVHDRVDATSEAFLGLTLSCAQCHDHKYDPIPQRDYYSFFAYFNSIEESGGGERGDMPPLMNFFDSAGKNHKVMVMRDKKQPRITHLLERGAWDHPGATVEPATLSALPALRNQPPNRSGLANWLIDPSNPLTARVAVNHLWQQLFGQGLVRTPDNFGVQGDRPTHPELLDYLAYHFIESGWNVKSLLREIVTSATYQQSSNCSPGLLQLDPENKLLARAPRFRLGANVLRDQALFTSGILIEKLGGPPVKPYHPSGVWEDVSFGRLKYQAGTGDDLYRRSLYTFWRRAAPPANMFDVSQRQRCSVRVIRTNTPLQALTLMNDPTYAEAAAALAEKTLRDGGETDTSRLVSIFETVLSRPPSESERSILTIRLASLRDHFAHQPAEAQQVACAGERADPPTEKQPEIAAWASVITIIFNLDETMTRE